MNDNTIAGFGPSETPAHQHRQHHRQMLLAVTIVMLEMISLVFQGVEGLILDLPPSASGPHYYFYRAPGQLQILDPRFNQALESRVKERAQMVTGYSSK
jgi:hypothetical protein